MMSKVLCFFFLLVAGLSNPLAASPLRDALRKAAVYFTTTAVQMSPGEPMVIDVVNLYSKKSDQTAQKIRSSLYFALEEAFPQVKLILMSEAETGVSLSKTVIIKGTYEPKGAEIVLRFQATRGLGGQVIAQKEVRYLRTLKRKKTLIAVLDIEAKSLSPVQRKAFSDVYRSALKKTGKYEMASSDEVSKMAPDAIQKEFSCTRDECGTIIGQQLGVDRVITTTYSKIADHMYFLTSKVLNIKDGSMGATESLVHDGNIKTFVNTINELAKKLADQESDGPLVVKKGTLQVTSHPAGAVIMIDGEQQTGDDGKPLRTPWTLSLAEGDYQLGLKMPGYQSPQKPVSIAAEQHKVTSFDLLQAKGTLSVTVPMRHSYGTVYVNGKPVGTMDGLIRKNFEVAAGESNQIQVRDKNLDSEVITVSLNPGEAKKLDFGQFAVSSGSPVTPVTPVKPVSIEQDEGGVSWWVYAAGAVIAGAVAASNGGKSKKAAPNSGSGGNSGSGNTGIVGVN